MNFSENVEMYGLEMENVRLMMTANMRWDGIVILKKGNYFVQTRLKLLPFQKTTKDCKGTLRK